MSPSYSCAHIYPAVLFQLHRYSPMHAFKSFHVCTSYIVGSVFIGLNLDFRSTLACSHFHLPLINLKSETSAHLSIVAALFFPVIMYSSCISMIYKQYT